MTDNHFQSHFSPFQTNRQYATFFFCIFVFKMATSGHLGSRFLPKSIGTALYSRSVATSKLWSAQASYFHILVFRYSGKSIGFFHSWSSMPVSKMNLIHALVSWLREAQALVCGGGVQTKTIISPKYFGDIIIYSTVWQDIYSYCFNLDNLVLSLLIVLYLTYTRADLIIMWIASVYSVK